MTDQHTPYDLDPGLPFKYIGGDLSLDFVNTVDWTDDGLVDERLATYRGLTRWAEGAGVILAADAVRLRRRAAAHPALAAAAFDSAVRLRGVLQPVFALSATVHLTDAPLQEFNAALSTALGHLLVAPDAGDAPGLRWSWRGWGVALDCVLWPVVWSAARLLTSDERAQVRVCAGLRCGWIFVDRSRNGLRRWCQTGVCGAQAKARRHHARRRAGQIGRAPG